MIDGQFALNFLRGVLATVNPCGFVLLPTYLMFFLGTEGARPGTQRASVQRALVVSASVAAGFFAVFLVIGLLVQGGVTWLSEQFDLFGLVIGVLLVIVGVAMLFGFKLPLLMPQMSAGGKDRTFVSMLLYGVSYAVASLGCTLPLFVPALASASYTGYVSAGIATLMFALGMGITLTALTVALALARTGMLRVMRTVMVHLDVVAGALMVLTGIYLVWYWGTEVRKPGADKGAAVNQVEDWQAKVANWLNDMGVWPLVLLFGGVTLGAIVFVLVRRSRPPRAAG